MAFSGLNNRKSSQKSLKINDKGKEKPKIFSYCDLMTDLGLLLPSKMQWLPLLLQRWRATTFTQSTDACWWKMQRASRHLLLASTLWMARKLWFNNTITFLKSRATTSETNTLSCSPYSFWHDDAIRDQPQWCLRPPFECARRDSCAPHSRCWDIGEWASWVCLCPCHAKFSPAWH